MEEVIIFFKSLDIYDEEVFNYIASKTKVINKDKAQIIDFIGDYINNDNFNLILPKINDVYDILIYIHEYSHILFNTEDEIIPNIMESLYVNNFIEDEKLKQQIINNTEREIDRQADENHRVSKKIKLLMIKENVI